MVSRMTNMGEGYALSSYTVPSNTNIVVELPKCIYEPSLAMWLIVVELPKAMWLIVIELPKAMWWSISSCSTLGGNKQKRAVLLKGSWQVHHYMSSGCCWRFLTRFITSCLQTQFLSNKKPRDQPDLRSSYIFQPDIVPWHSQMSKHTNATTVVKGFMTILLDHRSYPKPLRTAHTPNHSDHSSDPWLSRP